MKINIKKTFGFTLIEVIVAMALAAILGIALIAMVLQAQSIANSARLRNQATKYAEGLLETMRIYRAGVPWSTMASLPNSSFGYGTVTPTTISLLSPNSDCATTSNLIVGTNAVAVSGNSNFSQCLKITSVGPSGSIQVIANIYFSDRGLTKLVNSSTILSNLQ